MGVVAGELRENWGTVLAAVVGGIDAAVVAACQGQRVAGASPRWSRRRASSPAAVVAAGIAGGLWEEALDRWEGSWDVDWWLGGPPASRRRMFRVLGDGRRLTGDGGARVDRNQTEVAVAGLAAVAVGVLLRTGHGGRGSGTLAGRALSALRRSRELPAAVGVAFLEAEG